MAAVAIIAAGALSSCAVNQSASNGSSSAGGGDESGPITITGTVWSDWAFIQEAGEAFKKDHPNVTVKLNAIPDATYFTKIPDLFASADSPDFTAVAADSVYVPSYVQKGVLAELDDVWASSGLNDHAPAALKDQYTIDGHQYAINVGGVVIPVIYYNKKLFEQAGISQADVPSTGMTVDQFYAINNKLKTAGIGGLTTGMGDGSAAFRYFSPYFTNACGDAWVAKVRANDTTAWADPCVKSALDVVKGWTDNGVFEGGSGVTTGASAAAEAAFGAGKAAMEMEGTWAVGAINKAAADGFEVGWFTLPTATSQPITPSVSSIDGLAVSKNSKHLEMTKEFIAFLASYDKVWEHGIVARDDVPAPSDTDPLLVDISKAVATTGTAPDLQQLTPAAQVTVVNNAINAIIAGSQSTEQAATAIGSGS